jgi:hypothetical protein
MPGSHMSRPRGGPTRIGRVPWRRRPDWSAVSEKVQDALDEHGGRVRVVRLQAGIGE